MKLTFERYEAGVPRVVLDIHQGETVSLSCTYKDDDGNAVNLTGYTAALTIRPSADSDVALLSLTQVSGITLGGALGTIVVALTATQTAALTAGRPAAVFDLEITSGATVTPLLKGTLNVYRGVTR